MPPISLDATSLEIRARALRAAYLRDAATRWADALRRRVARPARA